MVWRNCFGISRTVKKQEIGLAEQGTSQGQTHTPTTGECPGGELLSLGGETKTSQYTGSAGLGLVGLHLGELRVDISQGNIQTLPLVIQSGSILRSVCHLGTFFFKNSQLLGNFLCKSPMLVK
jgi:hypothetical protein